MCKCRQGTSVYADDLHPAFLERDLFGGCFASVFMLDIFVAVLRSLRVEITNRRQLSFPASDLHSCPKIIGRSNLSKDASPSRRNYIMNQSLRMI